MTAPTRRQRTPNLASPETLQKMFIGIPSADLRTQHVRPAAAAGDVSQGPVERETGNSQERPEQAPAAARRSGGVSGLTGVSRRGSRGRRGRCGARRVVHVVAHAVGAVHPADPGPVRRPQAGLRGELAPGGHHRVGVRGVDAAAGQPPLRAAVGVDPLPGERHPVPVVEGEHGHRPRPDHVLVHPGGAVRPDHGVAPHGEPRVRAHHLAAHRAPRGL